jgi:hypothetical protein
MPRYTEKPGGLPCHQVPSPNLHGRCRPTGEQIHNTLYSQAIPRKDQHSPLDRLTPALQKKKLNNKQETEKDKQQRGWGALSALEKGGGERSCSPRKLSAETAKVACWQASPPEKARGELSPWSFSKQTLQKWMAGKPVHWRRGKGDLSAELSVNKPRKSSQLTVGGRWVTAWNRVDSSSQSYLLTQSPGETTKDLLFKYQHQDWMLKEWHQNY